ncbi:MAG TPA: OsmC family protein [Steroidobacteraceae bacterium]|jgi:putative redox protein|nr:OsmC family protein [Steroidobacteraceae bacterium]
MSVNAFDAALAGESVLVTETRMEDLQLLGRVGSTSFVISGSRRNFSPESLNPYELMGAALGSSTAMTVRRYADRMELPLVRVQVSVSHHPSGEQSKAVFERRIILEGDELSDEQRQRLLDIADHCPVDQTLAYGAEIHTSMSTDHQIAAAPATSDYIRDIDDRISALQETLSPTE